MGRLVFVWVLAAGLLGSMRLLASWSAEQDPADIPELLRQLLPDAPPAQNSELGFDPLFFHFGEILEGEEIETSFRFVNDGKAPVRILRARHCGCVKIELPLDTPIAPGESGELVARLRSHGRTGVQVKPIELFTDEEGEGPQTGVLLKGSVSSPAVLRRENIVWTNAAPGESRRWEIGFELDEMAGRPEIALDADFASAELELDGDGGRILVELRAPTRDGVAHAELMLSCPVESGAWSGTTWSKPIALRVHVPAAFTLLGDGELDASGEGSFTLRLNRPEQVWVQEVRVPSGAVEVVRKSGEGTSKIQRYSLTRQDGAVLPQDATIDLYSNLDPDQPLLQIPIVGAR